MGNLSGLIAVISVFVVFVGIIFILYKKNMFGRNNSGLDFDRKYNYSNLNLLQLQKKNKELTEEIVFLENKIEKLKLRIQKLKRIIIELEEQKEQLEENEKQILKLKKQKDETLSMVAHDIKNPAATIKNFVELLESYDLNAQEQHEIMAGLVATSNRILKLADEFSAVVSEEKDLIKLNKKKHNINDTVDNIVKSNKSHAESKEIVLNLRKSKNIPDIKFDENKIEQVLDNFVGNAIKFSPPNTKVDILTEFNNNYIVVEIKDNGYGLTEEEISRAFEKGTKLSTKPTGNEKSSGLGLWIAKRIVEEHNGKVWVKSKKGVGATFAFKLPLK